LAGNLSAYNNLTKPDRDERGGTVMEQGTAKATKAKAGNWVQIRQIILDPGERASQMPDDTKKTPLVMWVKGFLTHDASIGDVVSISTFAGRTVKGVLVDTNPRYVHGFGEMVPELQEIGLELRQMLNPEGGS
jgi:hypothetical protein